MPSPLAPLRTPALRGLVLAGVALAAALLAWGSPGCRSLPAPGRVVAAPEAATSAFEEARTWARAIPRTGTRPASADARDDGGAAEARAGDAARARDRARAAALRSRELAPDWVPPRRLLDDLARLDLLGLSALEEHRTALGARPDDPGGLYLAGRLEGARGRARFRRAVELDPDFAWGYHGLAWAAAEEGDADEAMAFERAALMRARSSFERSYFTAALARFHVAADEAREGLELLLTRLEAGELTPVDRIELGVQAALVELGMVFRPEHQRGWERALTLLRDHDLTDGEVSDLVSLMRLFSARGGAGELELQLALASRSSPARDRLRAELMLESRSTPLALGLLKRSRATHGTPGASGLTLRAARFAAGQIALAVEEWLRDVPSAARDAQGLPRDPALRQVVLEARALGPRPDAVALASLGERLVTAGWFREARSVASVLAAEDLDAGIALEDRAAAGLALVEGLRRLMSSLDERARAGVRLASAESASRAQPAAASGEAPVPIEDLDGLLAAMSPLVARAQTLLGGEVDEERVERDLVRSPRLRYGPIGTVIHPGPRFSALDQAEGRGRRGENVPGLAALCARLGRFGLFGQLAGDGGPDGTLLQRVLAEEQAGRLLGVSWSGTVVLCEGVDLLSRAGLRGASIAGAALHEGFWLDFDALRDDRDRWAEIEREFAAPAAAARLERALQARGLALESPESDAVGRRRERRDIDTLLGQADRVRLAVIRDRLGDGPRAPTVPGDEPRADAGLVPLDELVAVTSLHEQAHLCERTRFLPLSRHLGDALGLLYDAGFSAGGVARLLEYRAELTALCEVPDPRIVLVAVLSAAEGSRGVTYHPAAYRELLSDLMAILDREVSDRPARWPEVDPERVLAHQLHLLGPERVRELALQLARRKGLVD